jgi:hypothetical protein
MNVRLQYDLEFLAGIYYEDQLQFNSYSVSVSLLTQAADAASSNIALERLKCFVYHDLANTVFFGPADHDKVEMFQALGTNVTTLPDAPVDQIVGMMLYCKLNAIMEDRMIITDLDISSSLGDSVWYSHNNEDNLGPFAYCATAEDAWWYNSSTQHHTLEAESVPDNVVKVTPCTWHEYGLMWPEERNEPTGNTVIYPDFRKHETK